MSLELHIGAVAKVQEVVALGPSVLGMQAHSTLVLALRQLQEHRAGEGGAGAEASGDKTGDIKSLTIGIDEEDESVRASREHSKLVLDQLTSLDDAKRVLQRTHAVALMAQVSLIFHAFCPLIPSHLNGVS